MAARVAGQPHAFTQEEGADLPDFALDRAHLLLREVYGDLTHNNDGSHLDRGVGDNNAW